MHGFPGLPQLLDEVERGETILTIRHGMAIARLISDTPSIASGNQVGNRGHHNSAPVHTCPPGIKIAHR